MDNTLKTTFTKLSDTETRYESHGEYTAFRGFIPKMMALAGSKNVRAASSEVDE